ncbi:hypothetical protein [Methylobacterium mesophilicum]
MSDLSDNARAVAAAWFGMMRPDSTSRLRFGMVESRPSERAQAGLDELQAAGVISREDEPRGAVVYRPLIECREHLEWAWRRMRTPEGLSDQFRLVDPIPPRKKPLKRARVMTLSPRRPQNHGGNDGA